MPLMALRTGFGHLLSTHTPRIHSLPPACAVPSRSAGALTHGPVSAPHQPLSHLLRLHAPPSRPPAQAPLRPRSQPGSRARSRDRSPAAWGRRSGSSLLRRCPGSGRESPRPSHRGRRAWRNPKSCRHATCPTTLRALLHRSLPGKPSTLALLFSPDELCRRDPPVCKNMQQHHCVQQHQC